MSKLIALGCLFVFFSCSFKKAQEIEETKAPIIYLDSDGDWIEDKIEIENGSDPMVADLPGYSLVIASDLRVSSQIISPDGSLKRFFFRSTENADSNQLSSLIQKKVSNFISTKDSRELVLKESFDSDYESVQFQKDDLVGTRVALAGDLEYESESFIEGEIKIVPIDENIEFKFSEIEILENSFIYNLNASKRNLTNELIPPQVFEEIISGKNLIYRAKEISFDGKSLSDLKSSILQKCVEIIISTGAESERIYYSTGADGKIQLLEILDYLAKDQWSFKNGELFSFRGEINTTKESLGIKNIKDHLDESKWFVLSTKRPFLTKEDVLTSGDTIILSYLSGYEILEGLKQSSFISRRDLGKKEETIHISDNSGAYQLNLTIFGGKRIDATFSNGSSKYGFCTFKWRRGQRFERENDFHKLSNSFDLKLIKLHIGETKYSLKELSKKEHLQISYNDKFKSLHISINLNEIGLEFKEEDPLQEGIV